MSHFLRLKICRQKKGIGGKETWVYLQSGPPLDLLVVVIAQMPWNLQLVQFCKCLPAINIVTRSKTRHHTIFFNYFVLPTLLNVWCKIILWVSWKCKWNIQLIFTTWMSLEYETNFVIFSENKERVLLVALFWLSS